MPTTLDRLYEEDFVAWTEHQANALRRLEQTRPNEEIDFGHLIEEVEDLGNGERDAVRSQIVRILAHLLKYEYSPAITPREGWIDTIFDARAVLLDKVTRPRRRDVEDNYRTLYERARKLAARRLVAYGEVEAAEALPVQCPYRLDQVLDLDWLPIPRNDPHES